MDDKTKEMAKIENDIECSLERKIELSVERALATQVKQIRHELEIKYKADVAQIKLDWMDEPSGKLHKAETILGRRDELQQQIYNAAGDMMEMREYLNHHHQVLISVQTNILDVQEVILTRAATGWTPVPIPTKSGTANAYQMKIHVSCVEPTNVLRKQRAGRNKFARATPMNSASLVSSVSGRRHHHLGRYHKRRRG
ncbi:hypothetical protein PHYPSEUDO_010665 [Phytophthora pseudosyringae]|uniref:Uncharacterized protein n=1 Tax=Phytophthora pseudosyringae TaxID=221518 RepID=A0A8T1WAY7_9STRA|nr:hypothetical protein PHYPSEUDO_010665 [Phytophthora pseudosyringae]